MPQPSLTNPLGLPFIELQSVDSTNNYAREQIHAACLPDRQGLEQHGVAFFAHEQIAGKGQRGKAWASEKGANIILSVVIKPKPLLLTQQFQLIACTAVAVHKFFVKYSGEGAKIKWPNDLYWQDRKAGGVLIENIIGKEQLAVGSGEPELAGWKWSIVGIGININQTIFPADLPNPVSLKQITGQHFNAVALAKELCAVLNEKFTELINNGFENIYEQYLLHLYKRNAIVKLKKDSRVFEATIKTVSPLGKLIVQHSMEEDPIAIGFEEIEWVL